MSKFTLLSLMVWSCFSFAKNLVVQSYNVPGFSYLCGAGLNSSKMGSVEVKYTKFDTLKVPIPSWEADELEKKLLKVHNGSIPYSLQVNLAKIRNTPSLERWDKSFQSSYSSSFEKEILATFHLKPEVPAQFYLEFCVLGQQLEFFSEQVQGRNRLYYDVPMILAMQTGYEIQTFSACDFQGAGEHKNGASKNGLYNSLSDVDNEANFTFSDSQAVPVSSQEGPQSFFNLNLVSHILSRYELPNIFQDMRPLRAQSYAVLDTKHVYPARFCKVRYVFSEAALSREKNLDGLLIHAPFLDFETDNYP